jgi:hypothetical protein
VPTAVSSYDNRDCLNIINGYLVVEELVTDAEVHHLRRYI